MARRPGSRDRPGRPRARPFPDREADRARPSRRHQHALLGQHRIRQYHPGRPPAARRPATTRWRTASAPTCAGTRWPWCCAPTRATPTSAATSPASPRRPRSTTSAFNISGTRPPRQHGGDLVFVQGHSAPGIYARAFLLGRLTEEQLDGFRQEVDGKGLPSYPHPWLMPDFWQFPTVSMGLGPLQAIYQARFMKYMHDRGLADTDRPQGLGLHGRRRDGRAGIDGRHRHGRAREARQPDLRRQLQPAAPRRPGARQRQDHPGTRSRFPRRRLERHQGRSGAATGTRCWPRTRTACCASA